VAFSINIEEYRIETQTLKFRNGSEKVRKILFFTNIERQFYLWNQASEMIEKQKLETVCSSKMIQESTPWGEEWKGKLASADIIVFRWMGTGLDCRFLRNASEFMQQNKIRHLFLVEDVGDDLVQYDVQRKQEILIRQYFTYGGIDNFYNCILWLSCEFCGEKCDFKEPHLLPWNGIYHPDAETIYQDLKQYKRDFYQEGQSTIGLVFYRDEWILGDLGYQTAIIREIEKRNMNAVIVFTNGQPNPDVNAPGIQAAFEKYFYEDGKVVIDVLINCIKFSLTTTMALELSAIQELNVPLLQAYTLMSSYQDWARSIEGMTPMEISVSVSLPEFDGIIHSIPIATKEENERGLISYVPIPERISLLIRKAEKWARLRSKPNAEKKVGIVFHNYPAVNSNIGSAAGLDSPESVRLLLTEMARQGYVIDHIPQDSKSFMEELISHATNDRRFITEKQIREAEGQLTTEQYLNFFKPLAETTKEQLERDWGKAPGDVFNYDGQLLIPGTLKGNVFITVQPPRGFGEDPSKLLHSPDCAPTHHYIGFYHWLRDIWQADVLIHVGTHGSLEWLPGKGAGMSRKCYPDISIDDMPNIYPYWITIVGEGVQAKRRSAACLISYLTPPMSQSGTYDELEELEKIVDEYCHFKTTQPDNIETVQELIREKVAAANLAEDIPENQEESFDEYVGKVHAYVTDIKNMQIRTGLHILGCPPQDEAMIEYLLALTRLENGEIPSLRQTLAAIDGFEYYELLENSSKMMNDGTKTYGAFIDEIQEKSKEIILILAKEQFKAESVHKIDQLSWVRNLSQEHLDKVRIVAEYICNKIVPNLLKTTQEITNLMAALQGEYVEPSAAGAPTSGGADLLPTGRNFYGIDPRVLPTPAAWEIGVKMGDEVISRYIAEEGHYPECVGIVLWAGANMRSHGQCVAEFLYLMGLRPVWQRGSMRVIDVEVIPIDELKRPRIDVTGRISGMFRDSLPGAITWLDKAVDMVAGLDESLDMNYIRKHVLADAAELEATGVDKETAWEQAAYRIFGDPPGAYGAGVGNMLESKNWETIDDLANVYIRFSGHAYGAKGKGAYQPELFKKRMAGLEITIKNEDNRECHMLSSDDFNAYHGGMIATVRSLSGKAPRSYCGDSSDRQKVQMRSLQEEVKRLFRGEAINPKFIQGMKEHGYKGAQDLANLVAHSYQWDATSAVLEDWMYEKYAEKYAFDPEIQAWMKDVNPWALQRLTEVLLEAEQRGLWNAKLETKQELQKLYLSLEGELEENSDANS